MQVAQRVARQVVRCHYLAHWLVCRTNPLSLSRRKRIAARCNLQPMSIAMTCTCLTPKVLIFGESYFENHQHHGLG
jgi:hypothetical protein